MFKRTIANTYTVTQYFRVPSQRNKENTPEQKNYYDTQKILCSTYKIQKITENYLTLQKKLAKEKKYAMK